MNLAEAGPGFVAFWQERHLATLTTMRANGTPHVVPVGVTLDVERGIARVISSGESLKARLVGQNTDAAGAPVAVCQVDGRRWSTLEGRAVLRTSPEDVAHAEARYTQRYKPPRDNPRRVVIEITVTRVKGNA